MPRGQWATGTRTPHTTWAQAFPQGDYVTQVSFKGFGLAESDLKKGSDFMYKGQKYTLSQGSIVIAAITSPQTLGVKIRRQSKKKLESER